MPTNAGMRSGLRASSFRIWCVGCVLAMRMAVKKGNCQHRSPLKHQHKKCIHSAITNAIVRKAQASFSLFHSHSTTTNYQKRHIQTDWPLSGVRWTEMVLQICSTAKEASCSVSLSLHSPSFPSLMMMMILWCGLAGRGCSIAVCDRRRR